MVAELFGGPLDGTVLEANSSLPPFLVLASNGEGLLYKPSCCLKCAGSKGRMKYRFAGYCYEHEEELAQATDLAREYKA